MQLKGRRRGLQGGPRDVRLCGLLVHTGDEQARAGHDWLAPLGGAPAVRVTAYVSGGVWSCMYIQQLPTGVRSGEGCMWGAVGFRALAGGARPSFQGPTQGGCAAWSQVYKAGGVQQAAGVVAASLRMLGRLGIGCGAGTIFTRSSVLNCGSADGGSGKE